MTSVINGEWRRFKHVTETLVSLFFLLSSTFLETIASLAVIAGCQPSYINLRYLSSQPMTTEHQAVECAMMQKAESRKGWKQVDS